MATPKRTARRRPVDRATVLLEAVTAVCELGFCDRCKGLVLSLLVEAGTRCQHDCHQHDTGRGAA